MMIHFKIRMYLPACLVLGAGFLLPSLGLSTVVRWMTDQEMVDTANVVVRGYVNNVITEKRDGMIFRRVYIEVLWGYKADEKLGSTFELSVLGGNFREETLNIPGSSEFRIGEEVIVFAEAAGEHFVELGIGSGKYRVERRGDSALVFRELGPVQFAILKGGRAQFIPRPDVDTVKELHAFELLLEKMVRGGTR